MTVQSTAKELKEQASIVSFLASLGYQPVRRTGKDKMYLSMLRDNDTSPSLSVNDELGVWFDHGTGKGGTIIDLGMAIWTQLTFGEVVRKIYQTCNLPVAGERPRRPRVAVKVPNYIVMETKPIGGNPVITDYLQQRRVFEAGRNSLQEVYYFIKDEKGLKKDYYAAGWKNEKGGWEVRNRYFKGCLGNKAITFEPGHPKNVAVFEGYLNYLSWKTEHPAADHSVIVLNSIALLRQGIAKAKSYSSIDIYFDRDASGFQATKDFCLALPYAIDRSSVFAGFNDYNDKLTASMRPECLSASASPSRSKNFGR
ncbi:toprim domain-containing protein [Mucilaginibacter sp. 21P]|uniref:hypothetical protein n=1 Tax=Mucilaginibacter sp. 21P TaxID=2778902 RepID=UPI001C5679D1|nr:hypothetical protein [Mucilaginibacter sp. 21P]QXV63657.1 toprim domain-containing protein [Mucilaginibacter sp. 21P]